MYALLDVAATLGLMLDLPPRWCCRGNVEELAKLCNELKILIFFRMLPQQSITCITLPSFTPLPRGSAIPHAVARVHSICSVTTSAPLHITVPTSAYSPAFPAALAFWGIPLLPGIRLSPAPPNTHQSIEQGVAFNFRALVYQDATDSGGAPVGCLAPIL